MPPASQVTSEHVTFAPTPGAGDVKTGQQESVQQVRPPPHQSRISPEGYRRCGMNKSHLCRVPPSPAPHVPVSTLTSPLTSDIAATGAHARARGQPEDPDARQISRGRRRKHRHPPARRHLRPGRRRHPTRRHRLRHDPRQPRRRRRAAHRPQDPGGNHQRHKQTQGIRRVTPLRIPPILRSHPAALEVGTRSSHRVTPRERQQRPTLVRVPGSGRGGARRGDQGRGCPRGTQRRLTLPPVRTRHQIAPPSFAQRPV